MTTPTNQVKIFLLEATHLGARLFRRNVGMGWIGQSYKAARREQVWLNPGDVVVREARPFHSGIVGQYDMYGWMPVTVTAQMVGTVIAQYVEVEAKMGSGRESKEQTAWGNAVRSAGGRAGVARSVEDVRAILG